MLQTKPKPCKYCGKKSHASFQCAMRLKEAQKRKLDKGKIVLCTYCDSTGHYSSLCPFKPKKQLGKGTVWKRWSLCKSEWYKLYGFTHPCHYCGVMLERETVTLDHLVPRSRAPELRYDFANLVPCCWICNGLKGSVSHDDYKHTCYS